MASIRKLFPKGHPKHDESPWVVEYTDPSGKRRRATPKSGLQKDAKKLRLKIELEIEQGVHIAESQSA